MFSSRRFLLGPPLLLVAAFCFGLVLIQSPGQSQEQPVAASHPASKTTSIPSKLSPVAPATPTTLSTAQTETTVNTSPTSVSSSTTTTDPQVSNTATAKLQATTSPADQTAKTGTKPKVVLKTTVNAVTKSLDNLIK